ncbi:GntR family transcriptional regulator [Nakamurella sp.]|uniref:GntR family transcriptional regulator n=1 Tax=Nakamurella sp. TaxID=1869182 RepID=UPI003B3B0A16
MLWQIDPGDRVPLQDQIAGCVRRAVAANTLAHGDRLPPAAELGAALGVDRNTVLAAYRSLRDEGLLEFRRGRGVRVAALTSGAADLHLAAARLIDLARAEGYTRADLISLIERMA